MPRALANDVELEFDTFGDTRSAPLLLITGAGMQMIAWDERFCELLAACGFYVVRFDNRDAGLSTRFEELGVPDLGAVLERRGLPPYTLDDMAADTVGLMDALGLRAAHVVGFSMGGHVAQLLAIAHPERVLTFTCIASSAGGDDHVRAAPEDRAFFQAPEPQDPEKQIAHRLARRRRMSGPHFDEERARALMVRSRERAPAGSGLARHSAAGLAAPSRVADLRTVRAPALVIHGTHDRMLPSENAKRIAAAVPAATLLILDDIGHEIPPQAWPRVIDAICTHAATAASA